MTASLRRSPFSAGSDGGEIGNGRMWIPSYGAEYLFVNFPCEKVDILVLRRIWVNSLKQSKDVCDETGEAQQSTAASGLRRPRWLPRLYTPDAPSGASHCKHTG